MRDVLAAVFAVIFVVPGVARAQCPQAAAYGDFTGFTTVVVKNIPATNAFSTGPVLTGGNPGAAFSVFQTVTGGVVGAQIALAHLEPVATPLPPTGLGAVDLKIDGKMTAQSPAGAFGNVVGTTFCVEQGGVVYTAPSTYVLWFLGQPFVTWSKTGLVASSFTDGLGNSPDFVTGGPVRFGFTTGNGNTNGGSFGGGNLGTTTSIFDNFTIGYAVVAASTTSVAGCGLLTPPSLAATPPQFGGLGTTTLSGATPGVSGALFVGAPAAVAVGGCVVGIDLATLVLLESFVVDGGGGASWSYPIPGDCSLSGATLALQAVVLDPLAVGGFALSNGVVVVVGI
jgi:hypothetical protein